VVAERAASVRLSAPGRIAAGRYDLVVTMIGTDRARAVSSRPLTVR